MSNREKVLSKIDIPTLCKELVPSLRPRGVDQLQGRCPFHDDKRPSLSVNAVTGKFMCHSGSCGKAGSIIDLLMGVRGCDFKKAMQELEQRAGIARPAEKKRHVTGRYEYYDPSGVLQYWKERIEPGSDGRSKEFCFYHEDRQTGRGGEPCLYNLPAVIQSISVFITEGEKQADILNVWGLTATTLDSGSQSKLTATMIKHLASKHIIILPDNDDPGREYATRIASALQDRATSLKVLPLPDLPEKGDVVEWADVSGNDRTRLLELVSGADEWEPNPGQPEAHSTNEQKAPAQPINKQPEDLRAFPKMYIDLERASQ